MGSVVNYGAVKQLHHLEEVVPAYFLCPISLELMQDPVTLCTGITYDRPGIDRWLNIIGQNTCPVSNQPLISKDLLPNMVLRSLILRWQRSATLSLAMAPSSRDLTHAKEFHSLLQRLQYISSPSHLLQALLSVRTLISGAQKMPRSSSRLALSTLTSLLCRSKDNAVLESALELVEILLVEELAEEGDKGFLHRDLVPAVVVHTMEGVSVDASLLSLRMLRGLCEKEAECRSAVVETGGIPKLLALLQARNIGSRSKRQGLYLLSLLCGKRF